MIVKKIFELPMLSSLLNHEPELLIKGLDISMILDGKDLSDANRHVCLSFKNVLCHKHTSERFTAEMYDAYGSSSRTFLRWRQSRSRYAPSTIL